MAVAEKAGSSSAKGKKQAAITAKQETGTHTKTMKAVNVENLQTDSRWNRPVGRRVEDMGSNWSDALANVIVISERESGDQVIIDGQHRAAAARIAGVEELIAEVHSGLSEKEEAKLYDELNTSRKTISAMDRFRSRVFYKDPVAMAIQEHVTKRGGKIRESTAKGAVNNDIAAIATLERIYRKGGEALLDWILDVIKDSFGELDSDTCSLMNLSGLLVLWERHSSKIDRDHLVQALKDHGQPAIRRMAMAHRQIWGGTGVMNGYRAIAETYNKGLPQRARLQL